MLAFALMSCATAVTKKSISVDDLSTDEKIGQLFAPDAYGVYFNQSSYAAKRLDRLVREQQVGGACDESARPQKILIPRDCSSQQAA